MGELEYLINKLESFRFNHKYQPRAKAEFRLPKPKTDSLRACSYGQKLSRFPRKHFDMSNKLFCSYGEVFSRLPGKVSRGDVDFVKCKPVNSMV